MVLSLRSALVKEMGVAGFKSRASGGRCKR